MGEVTEINDLLHRVFNVPEMRFDLALILVIEECDVPQIRQKEIGLTQLFSLGLGTIIGVGWITIVGTLLGMAGSIGTILGFVAGGLMITAIGLCYAELGSLMPVAGGEFAYAYRIFGVRVASIVGWLLALLFIVVSAFEAVSVGWVLNAIFPGVRGPELSIAAGYSLHIGEVVAASIGLIFIAMINFYGAKITTSSQDLLTAGLLVISIVFIGAALVNGDADNLRPYFVSDNSGSVLPGIVAVLSITPFFYAGFNVIPQAMNEIESRRKLKLLGRVTLLVVVISIAFYVLMVTAVSVSVTRDALLESELPAATAIESAFDSKVMGRIVLLAGLLGLFTTWNAVYFAATRLLAAMCKARVLPGIFSRHHAEYGSPTFAILFVGVLTALGIAVGRSVVLPVANIAGVCISVMFLVVTIAVVRLRISNPSHRAPFHVAGGLFIPIVAVGCSLCLFGISVFQLTSASLASIPAELIFLTLWFLSGVIIWISSGRRRNSITEQTREDILFAKPWVK